MWRGAVRVLGVVLALSAIGRTSRGNDVEPLDLPVMLTSGSCCLTAPPFEPDSCCAIESTGACGSPFDGPCCERPYLLGSPGGYRDSLAAHGIALNVSSTQFYQGVVAGGIDERFEYAGREDYLVNIDGQKAGLWQGLFITLHGETRNGEGVGAATGSLMPVNTATLFPQSKGTITALTGVKVTQALSETFVVFGGKINTLDELTQPFVGTATTGFMNMGILFPVGVARTIPYSTYGAGFALLDNMQPVVSMLVLDTNNTPTVSGFDTFFDNGATIVPRINIPVTWGGLPGHQGVWGTYSSGSYNNLQPTAYFDPNVGGVVTTGTDTGSWSIFYSADQALFVDPCNPKRSWGVFTNIGTADNGPSPIRFCANVGLGGSSPIDSRPLDTFGVGYSYVRYSDPVRDLAPILFPIGDDHAVELFYNYAVTPWFHLTPDLQILFPARERTLPPGAESIDPALVLGLRGKIDF